MSIKILVSTKDTQGARASDFSWVDEGEPVCFGFVCDRDAKNPNPDGGCGCGRSLCGVLSAKATTTFKVAMYDGGEADFVNMVLGAKQDHGWLNGAMGERLKPHFIKEAKDLLRIANKFPVGAVLELRKDRFCQRVNGGAK